MRDLQIFNSPEGREIRVVRIAGEPWFVASDVCSELGLGNVSQTVTRLDDEDRVVLDVGVISNDTPSLEPEVDPGNPASPGHAPGVLAFMDCMKRSI